VSRACRRQCAQRPDRTLQRAAHRRHVRRAPQIQIGFDPIDAALAQQRQHFAVVLERRDCGVEIGHPEAVLRPAHHQPQVGKDVDRLLEHLETRRAGRARRKAHAAGDVESQHRRRRRGRRNGRRLAVLRMRQAGLPDGRAVVRGGVERLADRVEGVDGGAVPGAREQALDAAHRHVLRRRREIGGPPSAIALAAAVVVDEVVLVEQRDIERALVRQLAVGAGAGRLPGIRRAVDDAVEHRLAVERLDEVLGTQAGHERLPAGAAARLHAVVELLHRQKLQNPERIVCRRRQGETVIGRGNRNELGDGAVVRSRRSWRRGAGISLLQALEVEPRADRALAVADDGELDRRRAGRISGRKIWIGVCVGGIVAADDVVDRARDVTRIVDDRAGVVSETDIIRLDVEFWIKSERVFERS
jgi:hypothetical protein